jgi:cytochrome c biogenesis protein CcmG/thiol:disulfide interchange protein DsbE
MWRYLIPGAIFIVLIGFFIVGLHRDPSLVPSPLIGKPAPAYSLTKVEDPQLKVASTDLLGKKHLVNVWATWCGGCRQEHEFLLQVAQQNVIPIVGIDWKDDMSSAQQWLTQLGNPYAATGFDGDGRVAIDFGVYGAPETFLVDERGVIIYKHIGILTADAWQNKLLPLIKGTAPESRDKRAGT